MTTQDEKTFTAPGTELAFWDDADYRQAKWKNIKRKYDELLANTNADSVQKRLACKRLCFLSALLESMEKEQIEKGNLAGFEAGQYIAMVNSMSGLLRLVGLQKQVKIQNLQTYLETQSKKTETA